ncbi:hypothetical protein M514_01693 [Trichuris suis]|uniref:EF-hand domain-containing protein n=1 Tax=Trichuris suis TaxID=68888 RepID=A0A085NSD7_9BILA|nr:hypothetical protein M514_01693 [Trichuris suis]
MYSSGSGASSVFYRRGNSLRSTKRHLIKPSSFAKKSGERLTLLQYLRAIWSSLYDFVFGTDDLSLTAGNLDLPVLLHRSAGIDYLTSVTDFSRNEVKAIYRGFREESPTGRMSVEEFTDMYGKLFPNAGTESFAKFVFGSFDLDKNGSLTFDGFLTLFSTLLRGTVEEKLQWVFKLYDTNKDGLLTQSDLEKILLSVYSLGGEETLNDVSQEQINEHANFIFKKMDSSRKGAVTCAEFVQFCLNDSVTSANIRQFTATEK